MEADSGSARDEGAADMTEYLIYFNQQWVGDHSEEWFRGRGPLARAVLDEIKAAGAYVFAGGLEEEDGPVFSADATSGSLTFTDGPYVETKEWLGGLTVVDVADEETARVWAGKIAEACGWPQEVRRFKPQSGSR
ncbi:YciI family protein [Nocardioides ungokensis]